MRQTLRDHRVRLKAHGDRAYTFEIDSHMDRLCRTLQSHLRSAGHRGISATKHRDLVERIVRFLFDAQDQRPMFHVEGTELPLCWNTPRDCYKDYIRYEWGHLSSRNQEDPTFRGLENLGLYSARCNQHIQTTLDVPELMV